MNQLTPFYFFHCHVWRKEQSEGDEAGVSTACSQSRLKTCGLGLALCLVLVHTSSLNDGGKTGVSAGRKTVTEVGRGGNSCSTEQLHSDTCLSLGADKVFAFLSYYVLLL